MFSPNLVLKCEELRSSRCSSSPNSLLPSFFPELRLLTKSPSDWRRAGTPPCWQDKDEDGVEEEGAHEAGLDGGPTWQDKDEDGVEEEVAHETGLDG